MAQKNNPGVLAKPVDANNPIYSPPPKLKVNEWRVTSAEEKGVAKLLWMRRSTDGVHFVKHVTRIILGLDILETGQILSVDIRNHRVTSWENAMISMFDGVLKK